MKPKAFQLPDDSRSNSQWCGKNTLSEIAHSYRASGLMAEDLMSLEPDKRSALLFRLILAAV